MVEQQHPAQAVQVQPHQSQVLLSHEQAVEEAVYTQVVALLAQAVLVAVEQVVVLLELLTRVVVVVVQVPLEILVVQAAQA
jgi:hypothetical protein